MSLQKLGAAVAFAAVAIGGISAAHAEDPPVSSMGPMAISRVVAFGQENQDPLALLTAVRMLNDLGAHVAMPGSQAQPTGEQAQQMYDQVALLEEAEGYAAGNEQLVAMIDAEMDNIESSRWVCYWEVYCDAYGWCEYVEVCY